MRYFQHCFGLFSLCALAAVLPSALPGAEQDLRSEIDRLVRSDASSPGGSLLVVRKGKIIVQRGYGFADVEREIRNKPETCFRIGSITKCFTALAILQLHEAGALNISDPVAKYLPAYPNAEKLSIRHLLTHTAGVSADRRGTLAFSPGDRVDYSNEGYMLLGQIVEKVSGQTYGDYLRDRIFVPLGMASSGVDAGDALVKDRARGYVAGPGGSFKSVPSTDASGAFSAGSLYSTVQDLLAFDQALYGEKIVKQATLREAFTPVKLNDGREGLYGYGWMLRNFRGLKEVGHGGDIEGFNSYLLRFPEQECTVIVLCNVSMHARGNLPTAGELAHRIAAVVLGDTLKPEATPDAVAIDSETMNRYVGVYEYDAPPEFLERTGKTLTVVREGNALFGIDKMGKAELVPESKTQFAPKGSPVKLIFRTDPQGSATEVLLNITGLKEISARRVR